MARMIILAGAVPAGTANTYSGGTTKPKIVNHLGQVLGPATGGFNDGTTNCRNPDMIPWRAGAPSNGKMLYERDFRAWICDLAADGVTTSNHTALVPLTAGGWPEPRFDRSPQWYGKRIWCEHDVGNNQYEIYALTLTAGGWTSSPTITRTAWTTTALTGLPFKFRCESDPRGRYLAWGQGASYERSEIVQMDISTGSPGAITTLVSSAQVAPFNPAFDPTYSRDGSRLSCNRGGNVYERDRITGTVTSVTHPDSNEISMSRYSPESDVLYFLRQPTNAWDLWGRQPDGTFRRYQTGWNIEDGFVVVSQP